MSLPFSQTITIVRVSEPGPTPTQYKTVGLIQQGFVEGIQAGIDEEVATHRIFLPANVTVSARDQIIESNRKFEVVGDPDTLQTPAGPHHIEALLRRVTN